MEENTKIKKMTPIEFVNYLEGYFMIIGDRGLDKSEASKIMEMLKNVEKHPDEQSKIHIKYDYISSGNETSIPDPNVYQYRETSVPDPNFCDCPKNICYCYVENKKGE